MRKQSALNKKATSSAFKNAGQLILCCTLLLWGQSPAFSQQKSGKKTGKSTGEPVSALAVSPTPAQERLAGIALRQQMDKQSKVQDITFRNVGPAIMSGRVGDLEVNPNDPTEFLVAYSTGGLWHTNNNGLSFDPIFDNADHLFMGDIAVHWPSKTIVVGSGEVNSSRSSYAGTGVYKSTDWGKTWEWIGLPESHHIGKVMIHPSDPNTIWVAALGHLYSSNPERGVFKTTDGGKNWKHTLAVDASTGAAEMEMDPKNPNILYAAMWYRARCAWNFEESGKTSGIYKSEDGGETWKKISGNNSGFPEGDGVGRTGLAVFPNNPNIVYAVLDNQFKKEPKKEGANESKNGLQLRDLKNISKEDFIKIPDSTLSKFLRQNRFPSSYKIEDIKAKVQNGVYKPTVLYDFLKGPNDDLLDASGIHGCEVYRSENGGANWKKVNTQDLDQLYSTYGYYFGKIFVSPTNDQKVYITGVPIMMSSDGGKTFKSIDGANVHSDHHALWINPKKDGHLINGNDGGVNITYDDGKNWFKANSIPVGQFYSVTVDDAKPYNIYGGLQDNGVWYGPSTHKENVRWQEEGQYPWKRLGGGDGMMVQVDTRDNSTFYFGSQFGAYLRTNKERTSFQRIRPRHDLGETPLRFNWETPILLSKHQQDVFYMGSNRFHRSLNRADTLINMSAELTKGGKPGDIPYGTLTWIAESPLQFGMLYVGTDDGLVYLSHDAGNSFTAIGNQLPADFWVSCITPSAFNKNRVYVSLNGYRNDYFKAMIYVSNDQGKTFQSIAGGLPPEPVNTLVEDHKNPNILYAGTDGGLYVTIDGGKTWMTFGSSMPKVPVHDLVIQQRENELVVATHGRSIFVAKLDEVQKLAQ